MISSEKPRGKYTEDLVLTVNEITIQKITVPISRIAKIEFSQYNDRKGKFKWHSHDFEASFSSGLDNKIVLHLKNKKKMSAHFLQQGRRSLKHHPELLTHYYKQGILHWLNLIDILEISNYDEIQEFKKQVNTSD